MNNSRPNPFIPLLIVGVTILLVIASIVLVTKLNDEASVDDSSADIITTNLSCGQACGIGISGTCVSGLECLDNLCKNPNCTETASCVCSTNGDDTDQTDDNDDINEEPVDSTKCNILCGGAYGGCPVGFECVNSEGNSAFGVGRCREPDCPKDLSCNCN
jgi:hypothetical protein